ncbi:MAG: FlgD immunoglobulin-like domain containing protein [Candidatus Kapaibacterium sp.]
MKRDNEKNRRSFLRTGLLGAAALTIVPRGLRSQSACDTTAVDYYGLGPFYSSGAPTRHVLAAQEEAGTRLFLNGTVYANDCLTPLPNVVLDIWHADDSGCYSRFEDCENPTQDDYKLRGIIRTGSEGTFALETVKPGHYLNGSQFRPSHIHLIVRHPEIEDLVTQLYFEGDPYIEIDAAASRPDAAGRIIPLEQGEAGLYGVFDIVLNVSTSGVEAEQKTSATRLRQNHPNPFTEATRIPFYLAATQKVEITIYDLQGKTITTLLHKQVQPGSHAVEWNGTDAEGKPVESGTYFCRFTAGELEQTRAMTKI